jgi:hypothetical protein
MHEIITKSFILAQTLALYLIRVGLQFLSCYMVSLHKINNDMLGKQITVGQLIE